MTKDEALKLALEALEDLGMKHFESTGEVLYKDTFTAIKEALMSVPDVAQPEHGWTPERIEGMARLKKAQDKKLAQPEQEPVEWGVDWGRAGETSCVSIIKRTPNGGIEVLAVEYGPQRTWVGLTEEDKLAIEIEAAENDFTDLGVILATEAKLKEKNT